MIKICRALTVIFLISACFCGCTVRGREDADNAAKAAVTNFVTAYYTIDKTDLENYSTITGGFIETEDEDGYWRFAAAVSSENKKFEAMMTEDAYQELVDLRMGYQRIREAYDSKYCCEVNSVILEEYVKEKSSVTYYYIVDITRVYINNAKAEQTFEKRQICTVKIGGQWRVSKVYY